MRSSFNFSISSFALFSSSLKITSSILALSSFCEASNIGSLLMFEISFGASLVSLFGNSALSLFSSMILFPKSLFSISANVAFNFSANSCPLVFSSGISSFSLVSAPSSYLINKKFDKCNL